MKRAKDNVPLVRQSFKKSVGKLSSKPSAVAHSLRQNLSPKALLDIVSFYEHAQNDKKLTAADSYIATGLINTLVRSMLGKDLLDTMGDSSDELVLLFNKSFAKFLGAPDMKFKSESNKLDVIDAMVMKFIHWTRTIKSDKVADTISRMIAIKEMKAKNWKPSSASLPDKDVMKSESASSPRLRFRVPSTQRTWAPETRNMYEIMFGEELIGRVESDPKIDSNRHSQRCWVCTLNDNFDDAEFATGFTESAPFTTVKGNELLLRNPARLTMREAQSWVRTVVVRDL